MKAVAAAVVLAAAMLAAGVEGVSTMRLNRRTFGDGYTNQDSPPPWVVGPAGALPAVPISQPAPIAPAGIIPADPFTSAHYFDSAPPQVISMPQELAGLPASGSGVWPPSKPLFPGSLSWAGTAPMRPLTLLDAKGGEYAKDEGKGDKKKGK